MKKVMVTCYDATFSKLCTDSEAVDYLLVGDSLGMVIQGATNTLSVSLAQMVYHTEAVVRGMRASKSKRKVEIISDLPVDTYRTAQEAIDSSRLLIEAGADMIKLEGPCIEVISALKANGFRICGHIGLTPQSILDFKVQGKSESEAQALKSQALQIERAGAEMIVLEMIPSNLAAQITESLKISTIGIGAGNRCSGQVLVLYDLLGLNAEFNPKFLKKFLNGSKLVTEALQGYANEVRSGAYPDDQHSFKA